jgi:hypothetical protein
MTVTNNRLDKNAPVGTRTVPYLNAEGVVVANLILTTTAPKTVNISAPSTISTTDGQKYTVSLTVTRANGSADALELICENLPDRADFRTAPQRVLPSTTNVVGYLYLPDNRQGVYNLVFRVANQKTDTVYTDANCVLTLSSRVKDVAQSETATFVTAHTVLNSRLVDEEISAINSFVVAVKSILGISSLAGCWIAPCIGVENTAGSVLLSNSAGNTRLRADATNHPFLRFAGWVFGNGPMLTGIPTNTINRRAATFLLAGPGAVDSGSNGAGPSILTEWFKERADSTGAQIFWSNFGSFTLSVRRNIVCAGMNGTGLYLLSDKTELVGTTPGAAGNYTIADELRFVGNFYTACYFPFATTIAQGRQLRDELELHIIRRGTALRKLPPHILKLNGYTIARYLDRAWLTSLNGDKNLYDFNIILQPSADWNNYLQTDTLAIGLCSDGDAQLAGGATAASVFPQIETAIVAARSAGCNYVVWLEPPPASLISSYITQRALLIQSMRASSAVDLVVSLTDDPNLQLTSSKYATYYTSAWRGGNYSGDAYTSGGPSVFDASLFGSSYIAQKILQALNARGVI